MACIATALGQSNNTFLKVITNFKRGYTICPAGDGNLYVGGAVIGRIALLKIAPNGDILSSDFLDFDTGNLDNISELIVDSDGMVAGCGTQGTEDLRRGFVFRYNPLTKNILWVKTLDDEVATLNGLLEKAPGGSYVVYGEVFYPTGSDALLLQVDRNTGESASPLTRRYHLGKTESFNAIVAHGSSLYSVGRATNGMNIFTELFIRSTLTRLDTATGTSTWTRLSGAPLTASAHLRGRDLIVDGDALIVTYSGNTTDPSLSTTTFFLQKHHFDGTIEWRKKYDLTEWNNEIAEEVIRVPDGYVLYGRAKNGGGGSLFLLKTNLDGNLVWARKLQYGTNDGFAQTESQQGQIVAVGNSLFFTATTEQSNGLSRMLLGKTNGNGTMGDSCTYWKSTPAIMSVPADLPDAPVMFQTNPELMPLVEAPRNTVLSVPANVETACQMQVASGCNDTLDLGADVILCRDSTVAFHAGVGFVGYLWQDGSTDSIYQATVPDVYWVEVRDSCGGIQRDSVLLTVSLLADTQFSDTTICPGGSLTYAVAGFDTYLWTPAAGLNCDTCAVVTLQPTATTTYTLLAQNAAGCTLTDTFTVMVSMLTNIHLRDTTICPGGSLTYAVSGFETYVWTPAAGLSCDTCATVVIQPTATTTYTLLAQNGAGCTLTDTFTVAVSLIVAPQLPDTTICPGQSVSYAVSGFNTYAWTPATGLSCDTCATVVIQPTATTTYTLLLQNGAGCMLSDTFTVAVQVLADVQLIDSAICPGESVTYALPGFGSYMWTPSTGLSCITCATVIARPNTTMTYSLLVQDSVGCAQRDTFTVVVLPLPARTELIQFLPGDTVTLGGINYTQPDTVMLTLPATVGCDTVVTYVLQFQTTATITCPNNVIVSIPAGDTLAIVDYTLPTAVTDCAGGGLTFTLLNSIPGGNLFALGVTEICYRVNDACGNTDICCFDVVVTAQLPPCDVKVNGCLRYELLSIKLDSLGNRRYSIRVVNNCAEALQYAAFEVPSGVTAVAPAQGAVFTAVSGRSYDVQNPNFSPFYSVWFKARPGTLLQAGAADVFEYKLPQQSAPLYLHVTAKLVNNQSYPAILNTFDCPVQPYPNLQPDPGPGLQASNFPLLFPNPTDGIVFANLSAWVGQTVELRITNAQGQGLHTRTLVAGDFPQVVDSVDGLPGGLYFLEIHPVGGQRLVQRLVIQR